MMERCACTCIGSYASFAQAMIRSFRQHHPDIPFYVLLAGRDTVPPSFDLRGVTLIRLNELQVPGLAGMLTRYDRMQVLAAVKPSLLRHMLDRGYRSVVFLDADMLVTESLEPVFEAVEQHSLTLSPHVRPRALAGGLTDEVERQFLRVGTFNGGFVGISATCEARRFLAWWETRLSTHCLEAPERGISYDQRWLDLASGFVADFHVLRDPGFNVAYWNLPLLEVARVGESITVDGRPLRLFHFSGFNPLKPQMVTGHYPAAVHRVEQVEPLADLFHTYASEVRHAGFEADSATPWPWDGWRHWMRWSIRTARRIGRKVKRTLRPIPR